MGRTRNVKPGFFTNEDLPECGVHAHLLFAGLWTIADKEGRLEDRPKRIKIQCLPHYDVDVDALLTSLHNRGFIIRYESEGTRYIQIVNWSKHQNPHHKESESDIPSPFTEQASLLDDDYIEHEPSIAEAPVKGSKVKDTKECKVKDTKASSRKRACARKHAFTSVDVKLPDGFDRDDVRQAIDAWLDYKAGRGDIYDSPNYLGSLVRSYWEDGPDVFVAAVHHSIGSNYKGVFARDDKRGKSATKPGSGQRHSEGSQLGPV